MMSTFARLNEAEMRRRICGIAALRHRGWKFRDIGLVYGLSESRASELFRLYRLAPEIAKKAAEITRLACYK